ncbi:MAG: 1-acyl-sn-glycerol-3-phosphate acyltransferase [Alphaproteobacteria bacterium]|nr:1-acyl-sn-glycerol-3-phosphate acyltransferase [Alphaproteobacteria bacterium]
MTEWNPDIIPDERPLSLLGWVRAMLRLAGLATVIYGLMLVLVLARLIELPFGKHPVSPLVVQLACKISLRILGLEIKLVGTPMTQNGALVCNHCSWLDILTLNSAAKVFFVSKSEVSKWPVIGLIARTTHTVFIERKSSQARVHKSQFERRLIQGDRLLFFPEGTSTDSRRVLPFKSTLFAAFFEQHLAENMWIQPTSLIYRAPKGEDVRFYGWWGEMAFAPHFLMTLATPKSGGVEIVFHDPVRVADFKDRKALAHHCETEVRAGLERAMNCAG